MIKIIDYKKDNAMQNITIFDHETVPNENVIKPEFDESTVKLGNVKDPDKRQAKIGQAKAEFNNDIVKKMSLDGGMNKIISIAAMMIDSTGEIIEEKVYFDEKNDDLINEMFLDWAKGTTLCGWNIKGFDIPVLWKRSILNGQSCMTTPQYLDLVKKYGYGCLDLMQIWNNYNFGSMSNCCKALKIPVKTEMSGSDVYKYYMDGRYEEIKEYNLEDVRACYEIYKRLYL